MVSRERMGRNLINLLNNQQLTNANTLLTTNMYKRVSTYLKLITGEKDNRQVYKLCKILWTPELSTDNFAALDPPSPLFRRIVLVSVWAEQQLLRRQGRVDEIKWASKHRLEDYIDRLPPIRNPFLQRISTWLKVTGNTHQEKH